MDGVFGTHNVNDPDGNSWALQKMPWRSGGFASG